MAIDFPASPTTGQTFTSGTVTYTWDGTKWTAVAAANSGTFIADTASAGSPSLTFVGDSNTGIYSPGADQLAITSSGSERIRIGATGEIGIGGANYGTSGQVLTSGGSGAAVTWTTPSAGGGDKIEEGNTSAEVIDTGSDGRFVVTTEGSERARVDSSGRLLLGTTSTSDSNALLQVSKDNAGGIGGSIVIRNGAANTAGNSAELVFKTSVGFPSGTNSAKIAALQTTSAEAVDLAFYTYPAGTGTERMRIGSDGSARVFSSIVGVRSNTSASAGTSVTLFIGTHSASSVSNGTASFLVWSNGNVQNTNNSYGSLSDITLKENITLASSQWSDIKDIEVVNYNFKEETGHQTHKQLGVIAQQVETVSPGLVDTNADGVKSVNYSVLYMKAVKALQEAMDRIETLEAKVAALEGV